MTPNPNPNEPNFPYSGGTDNPGDDTSHAGGPTNVAATETAPLTLSGPSLTSVGERHAPLPVGIAATGSDTVLPEGVQAVPPSAEDFEGEVLFRDSDPEGVGPGARESGQDEVAGATETTSGITPSQFPEPNP